MSELDATAFHYSGNIIATQCEFNLTDQTGEISSPGFESGQYYPDNVDCYWTIIVDEEQSIELEFLYFDLELSDECIYDFVRVSVFSKNA